MRNLFIITPGCAHRAVEDPLSYDDMSLQTACGRSLRDGQTLDPAKGYQPLQDLDSYPHVRRCKRCFA